jgi:hypothetical protein
MVAKNGSARIESRLGLELQVWGGEVCGGDGRLGRNCIYLWLRIYNSVIRVYI